jgi:hypothetical protein
LSKQPLLRGQEQEEDEVVVEEEVVMVHIVRRSEKQEGYEESKAVSGFMSYVYHYPFFLCKVNAIKAKPDWVSASQ